MKNEGVPALIKELRQRLALTQEQFAQRVGVTYRTVNHWENGKRVPLPFHVKRLLEMKSDLDEEERRRVEGESHDEHELPREVLRPRTDPRRRLRGRAPVAVTV